MILTLAIGFIKCPGCGNTNMPTLPDTKDVGESQQAFIISNFTCTNCKKEYEVTASVIVSINAGAHLVECSGCSKIKISDGQPCADCGSNSFNPAML